ncbi:hypothetical protein BJX65DRAFT_93587 [Aspergillus insuetus]
MVPGCGAAYFDFFNPRVSAVATSQRSQQIDPSLLPRSKIALSKISKKVDYALSFTCRDASVRGFYDKISLGGHGYQISQTTDAFTKRILLFSGMEIKSDDGGKKEALAQ